MTFDLGYLFLAAVAYLSLLFLIAYAAERGWLPGWIARHPATYVLSLGVYATSWSYYGSVGFAQSAGYSFLTIYFGVTLAFILTPVLLMPILRLTRDHQLTSLADLFAFRFRSQLAGILVTLFMLAGILPYIALQIRAVTESAQVLTQEATPAVLAFGFCVMLTLFAILFGARHISPREKHEGLMVAIAFESLVKLIALLSVGAFALYGVFGGMQGLNAWVAENPEALDALYEPARQSPWMTLTLLAFAASFLLPRQFHMTFTENIEPRTLPIAAWGFPLLLLLLNLPIVPILWAGTELTPQADPDYYVLSITAATEGTLLPAFAFIGGVSAASAMMIVTTLALAAMCLNHLLLPASYPDPELDVYRWVLWGRRMIIACIILAGYGFYVLMEHHEGLVELGLISFVAVAQFLPGVVGVLYWPRATRYGFIAGLGGGAAIWAMALMLPLMADSGLIPSAIDLQAVLGAQEYNHWAFVTFTALAVNTFLFVAVSLVTRPSPEEDDAADACRRETLAPPAGGIIAGRSPAQFQEQLQRVMGANVAEKEVRQALNDLRMAPDEQRPAELRRLRERIESNLSGLIGPTLAHMIINDRLQLDTNTQTALADSIRFFEERLESSRTLLRGLAAELDALRRYHRQVLQELPLGVCSVGPDGEVVIWNHAMEALSGLEAHRTVGAPLQQLAPPWGELLDGFVRADHHHIYKLHVHIGDQPRWLSLHKAAIGAPTAAATTDPRWATGGSALLVEDLTEVHTLETELAHSERLASIGRLAAGVAHEIGNPVTGIACLAQNLQHEDEPGEVQRGVAQILQEIQRIDGIVQSLLTFSHGGQAEENATMPVNLQDCLEQAVRLVRLSRAGRQVACECRCDPDLTIRGDRQRLLQVFVNLLTNACDASAPGATVDIDAAASGGWVTITLKDQGSGIPKDVQDRIFEPFFTTKEPGQGTGLGLAVVYNIVQDHGGEITIDSDPGSGTRIVLHLPEHGVQASAAVGDTDRRMLP